MRIIGIDPGIERTGFAVLEIRDGKTVVLDCGHIYTEAKTGFGLRLHALAHDFKEILRQWKPEAAGVEEVFFSKNVKTALTVAHARGVIIEILEEHGIPTIELSPTYIKMAVTGDGKADKTQMRKMIQISLGISLKNDDAADALACGICALTTHERNNTLFAALPAARQASHL